MNDPRRKALLLFGAITTVVIVAVIVLSLVFVRQNSDTNTLEPELGGGTYTVAIEDPELKLTTAFTESDFAAVRRAMTAYITAQRLNTMSEKLVVESVQTPFRVGDETTINTRLQSSGKKIVFIAKIPTNGAEPTLRIVGETKVYSLYGNDEQD